MDAPALKVRVRAMLRDGFHEVPAARPSSGKVHLEVWEARPGRAVGLEMDHDAQVNFWVTRMNVPSELPTTIERSDKQPKGRAWTDEAGRGANSNLSGYEAFRSKPITRLSVTSEVDAQAILEHLKR